MSNEDNKMSDNNIVEEKKEEEKAIINVLPLDERLNEAKYLSCQKKDIFYHAFRNIRERYQYKEQRTQKIASRFKDIASELKLPLINTKNNSLKIQKSMKK